MKHVQKEQEEILYEESHMWYRWPEAHIMEDCTSKPHYNWKVCRWCSPWHVKGYGHIYLWLARIWDVNWPSFPCQDDLNKNYFENQRYQVGLDGKVFFILAMELLCGE